MNFIQSNILNSKKGSRFLQFKSKLQRFIVFIQKYQSKFFSSYKKTNCFHSCRHFSKICFNAYRKQDFFLQRLRFFLYLSSNISYILTTTSSDSTSFRRVPCSLFHNCTLFSLKSRNFERFAKSELE